MSGDGEQNKASASKILGLNRKFQFSNESLPLSVLWIMKQATISRNKYKLLHLWIVDLAKRNVDFSFLPSSHDLFREKKFCVPATIEKSEKGAQISIQSLLDHHVSRLAATPDICKNVSDGDINREV